MTYYFQFLPFLITLFILIIFLKSSYLRNTFLPPTAKTLKRKYKKEKEDKMKTKTDLLYESDLVIDLASLKPIKNKIGTWAVIKKDNNLFIKIK